MPLDLSNRKWPGRPKRAGKETLHDSYVREGQMVAVPLAFPHMTLPMPADESYITALGIDDRQVLYGGTGGPKAHLFATMTRGLTGTTIHMAELQDDARTTAVLVARDGRVIAATSPGGSRPDTDPHDCAAEGEGALFIHEHIRLPYDLIHEWHFLRTPAETLAVPVPGEGIACAVLAAGADGREVVVGLSAKTGTLFVCDVSSGDVETVQPVDEHGLFSHAICVGPEGKVYGTATEGRLWSFDPVSVSFAMVGAMIPTLAGRARRNQADSFAVDAERGAIYGGGTADGVLFSFEPATGTVRALGKATGFPGIRACAVTRDGRLFGFSGRDGDLGHLFCYNPDTHELKDLGLACAMVGERVYGYQFSCSVVGRDGQVFFGEHDRGGHVWTYWPAIQART